MSEIFETKMREFDHTDEIDIVQLVGLKLGDEEYAIDVLKIQEIIRTVEITIVPRMDNYILGVMNLRGKVIPVIDLRVRFNLERCDFDKSTRIIVVRFEKQNIGFVVDEVTEVIRISRGMVEPTPPLVGSIGQEYILGICKYDDRLIMLLDIDRVINEGGEYVESDLRRKMIGTKNKIRPESLLGSAGSKVADEHFTIGDADIDGFPESIDDSVEGSIIDNAHFDVEEADDNRSAESSISDNIDNMIASELAKREAETVALNKSKKEKKTDSVDDVLNSALSQSAAIFKGGQDYIMQGDLDNLLTRQVADNIVENDKLNELKHSDIVDSKGNINMSNLITTKVADSETTSIGELKRLADKIITGEKPERLDTDIKGEIAELLKLIIETKSKVDDIDPVLKVSRDTIPHVTSTLEDVNKTTEKATLDLLSASNEMSSFYKDFVSELESLKGLTNKDKAQDFLKAYDKATEKLSHAEDLGFKILEALEFQDITEQRLRKVMASIEDMGSRIGAIVGLLDGGSLGGGDKKLSKLLADYGLV